MKRMKLGLASCCVACLLGAGIPVWAQSQPKERNGWMILADIPHPQIGCSGAVRWTTSCTSSAERLLRGEPRTITKVYDSRIATAGPRSSLPDRPAGRQSPSIKADYNFRW